jgi:hypothetical protein
MLQVKSHHFIEIVSITISHRPNGGNNQVCATEFDQDASGLRSPAGSWVITISVYVVALFITS